MDKAYAVKFSKMLKGKKCRGWRLGKLINAGKSAVVLEATKRTKKVAFKVFDPELIGKHGAEVQAQRITRERSLIGKSHPNLIKILDGGFWEEEELFFVVMEFLPWKNLAEVLQDIPVGRERRIIAQVAAAARFLEQLGICHRDIKPENIVIDADFKNCKLLDLGVIKPVDSHEIPYGPKGGPFVGTLQYSPPEFLLGVVNDSTVGWRAVTFYQLGAVLHDLVMRRPLFAEYANPFGRLVVAVKETKPEIESAAVSPALVILAKDCLLKNPETRTGQVTWKKFEKEPPAMDVVAEFQSKITRRVVEAQTELVVSDAVSQEDAAARLAEYAENVRSLCALECIGQKKIFPPIESHVVSDEMSSRRVSVSFDPSGVHLLSYFWRFEVQITWTDQQSEVIEIKVGASISRLGIPLDCPWSQQTKMYFRGLYTPDAVRRAIIPALYSGMYSAQGAIVPAHGDNSVHPLNCG